jgi:hypothetical protein
MPFSFDDVPRMLERWELLGLDDDAKKVEELAK